MGALGPRAEAFEQGLDVPSIPLMELTISHTS